MGLPRVKVTIPQPPATQSNMFPAPFPLDIDISSHHPLRNKQTIQAQILTEMITKMMDSTTDGSVILS